MSRDLKKKVRNITCLGSIATYASNTFRQKRFALEQHYTYSISSHGLQITSHNLALEDIKVFRDNATQLYLSGFTPLGSSTMLFWGGETTARVQMPTGAFNSGSKTEFPKTLGISLRHPVSGEYTCWVDLDYGIGDRRYLSPTTPLFEHNKNSAKIYPRLFGMPEGVHFAADETYSWRGGYYWGMPTKTDIYDTVQYTSSGFALVKPNGRYVLVPG